MHVRIHAALFQHEAFGPSFMHELKKQFQFSTGDFNSLIQKPLSLSCMHIDDLPESFELTNEHLEFMVFLGHRGDASRAIQLLDRGCADFILPPEEGDLPASFVGVKLRILAERLHDRFVHRHLSTLEDQYGLHLTDKERRLMYGLLKSMQEGMTRQELVKACWPKTTVNHKTLDTHLFNLRRKLEIAQHQVNFADGRWSLLPPNAQNESKIS